MKNLTILKTLQLRKRIHSSLLKTNNIKLFLFLNILFICNIESFAKEVVVEEWVKSFGGSKSDYLRGVTECSDGNFIGVGYTYSDDMGFELKGEQDGFVVKYNAKGEQIWMTPISGSGDDVLTSVAELSDGSIVVAGHSNSSDLGFDFKDTDESKYGRYDYIIIKLSKDGKQLWIKNYSTGYANILRGMIKTSNDDILCIGFGRRLYSSTSDAANLLVVKFDKNGNMLWSRNWGGSSDEDPVANTIVETSEGDYIIATYTRSSNISGITNKGGQDIGVVKYSSSGDLLWQKSYGGSGNEGPGHSIKVNDNEIYIVGSSTSTDFGFTNKGERDAIIISINIKTGDLNWIKNFGGSKDDVLRYITPLSDGNFACIGYSASSDFLSDSKGDADIFFLKLDKDLNILLNYSFGGSGSDDGWRIVRINNNELILVGYSSSKDANFNNRGNYDCLLIKIKIVETDTRKSTASSTRVYLMPNNVLELSLSTNSIIFENFSILEAAEKLDAVEIKVSSSLAYDISVSLETDIIGQSDGNILDPSTINLKLNTDSEYKSFSQTQKILYIAQNQPKGNDKIYSLDMKIKDNKVTAFDIYKTVLKFEVYQT